VLSAIERYWKAEEDRGRGLIVAQEDELRELAGNSDDILKKPEQKLEKHRKLAERGNLTDKLKWTISTFAKDVGPMRQALQDNTQALAIFNAALTAENASEQSDEQMKLLRTQGRLLEYLVVRYWEFQTGTGGKAEPAFSQFAVKDISEDGAASWQVIDAELKETGFESSIVLNNRGFIRNWIGTVILEEDEKDVTETSNLERALEDAETQRVSHLSIAERSHITKATTGERTEKDSNTPQAPRPVSPSSHRSQSSTWRDPNASDPSLAAKHCQKCSDLSTAMIAKSFMLFLYKELSTILIGLTVGGYHVETWSGTARRQEISQVSSLTTIL
jgi:hypothetical protein